jgi:phenylpropionate dioxygenase-like ring-hydroxylating dioxygenase large terminal subunit
MTTAAHRRPSTASRLHEPYLEAAWGLHNHWYPAAFSHELPANQVRGVMICGHEIALRRGRGGKVYALADRCRIAACASRRSRCA